MPKCASVQLQLWSEYLFQDIKDFAFFRKLRRFGHEAGRVARDCRLDLSVHRLGLTVGGTRAEAQASSVQFLGRVAQTWRVEIFAGTKFLHLLCL